MILAGIDEAGLGPLLGPLVVGYSAFRVPDPNIDLWSALDAVVARDLKLDAERLIVDDSKRVFSRNPRGARRLETTALSFLTLLHPEGRPPQTGRWLFEGALAPDPAWVEQHPWYAHLPERLPLHRERGAIELRAARLGRCMASAGVELVEAGVRVVPAGELNASFDETRSKGTTLWLATAEVLTHLWEFAGEEPLYLLADQHGGRTHYGPPLARSFPKAQVRATSPSSQRHEFELQARGQERRGSAHVTFAPKGDQRSFATALASCLAKYARETCMGAFNDYWLASQPQLRPTAGYTTDGRRWLQDAEPSVSAAALPGGVLVRDR